MADTQPTAEQVEAANKAEEARWQDDFDEKELNVPYKREEVDESKGDPTADTSNGKKTDEEIDPNKQDDPTEVEEYSASSPVVTVQDPGDFQPGDYSFEVTLKDGKTHKITTPEEADKLADDPENFDTPKQLADFIKKSTSMSLKLERDKEKWEESKQKYDEQVKLEQEQQETISNYAAEFDYLVSKGLLPKIDKQYAESDWSDPEVAKQEGVKQQLAVLNYMAKENQVRAKAKVKPITSIVDAFNAWKLENKEEIDKEAAQKRAEGEARKAASARVASSSPAQQGSYVPKGIAVGNPNVFNRGASVWDD